MKKSNLLTNAFVLSVGAILAKIFSAVYRIGLTRILGGEGIGIYQLIFPFYSLCVTLATAGLPLAISKVIAKNNNNEKSVLKKCFVFALISSIVLTFVLLIFSKGLATLQGKKEISLCYIILAPTIIFVCVSSVLRGYFQGKHNFVPSSVSNIVEQFIKLVVGLILSLSLISFSLLAAVIGAVVAIVISEVVSLIVLLCFIKNEKIKNGEQTNVSIKTLLKDIFPITLNNIILPIASFIDSILVVNLLSINHTNNMSVFLYGIESGAVASLVSLPTIFSFAIASVILPNLTTKSHNLNKSKTFTLAIKIVLVITIPCVVLFTLVPNRLINVLYNNRLNGFGIDGSVVAARLLAVSGLGVVFLALNQLFSSGLQAVEERYVATRNLTIGVVLKFVIELLFLPSKGLNIYALAIANTVCYLTVMILNLLEIRFYYSIKIDYNFIAKLTFSNAVSLMFLILVMMYKNSVTNTIFAVVVCVVVYFVCLILTNMFSKRDKAIFKYKV